MSRARDETSGSAVKSAGADRAAFIERLQTILRHWPSADRLARAMGVSPSAFRKWLKGEAEPSRERLVALAEASGVGVGWLARGEGPEPDIQGLAAPPPRARSGQTVTAAIDPKRFAVLPKHPEAAAAGVQTPPPPSRMNEYIAFRHDWIRATLGIEPDDLLVETAAGESMLPGIRDNDLLLVDRSEREFRSFGIYVLEFRGERLVKRVQRKLDGSVTLISDNTIYEVEHIPPELADDVEVVGRVVWSCGPV